MADGRTHRLPVRIYYEDTDFSGVVYHAAYLKFLERGRTEFLRDLGVSQAELFGRREGPPLGFAVSRMTIDFRRPARMDDLVIVETDCMEVRGASLTMRQRILRDDAVLTEAEVLVAAVAADRPTRLPAELKTRLAGVLTGP